MYLSKKSHINIWDTNHSEKIQLPPPPPVPPHRTPPANIPSPSSQLMRCTSMPHAKRTTNTTTSDYDTTATLAPARPVSWHPIPCRRTSRFCQNDPEIKAKLDRISQSERLLSLRTKFMHS